METCTQKRAATKRILRLALTMALAIAMLVGCGPSTNNTNPSSDSSKDSVVDNTNTDGMSAKTTLDVGLKAEINGCHPYYNGSPSTAISGLICESLTDRSPEGEVVPYVAKSWKTVKRFFRTLFKSPGGIIGLILIAAFVFCAAFAPFIAPADPMQQNLADRFIPPGSNPQYLLGTDQLGRDMLSRLIYGSRVSVLVAVAGTAAAMLFGLVLGSIAGFYGKFADSVIGRLMDIQLAFPFMLLAIFIVSVMGASLGNIILVAGIAGWVRFARVVRGEILSVKQMEYVEAITALGGTNGRIVLRHIYPNIVSPVIVIATLEIAKVVLMEASLSYLGMGTPISVPTWGRMLSESRDFMQTAPWMAILPGAMVSLLVLAVNLFGDWLRDYLDPRVDSHG